MYAGSTLTKISGSIIGAHQKIDRIARKHLEELVPDCDFPSIKNILHFEGNNGPDGIKRKSPSKDEPWHFIKPEDKKDTELLDSIDNHFRELVKALKEKNETRSAFEAAWLAHAVVDGLTPAHHYPYTEELSKLRNGESNSTRNSIKKKLIMNGETGSEVIKNNWKMWGPKGLFTTHAAFELGVATIIAPLTFNDIMPTKEFISSLSNTSLSVWFRKVAKKVVSLNIYNDFYDKGWTVKLSHKVKEDLIPIIINTVTTVWLEAYKQSKDL